MTQDSSLIKVDVYWNLHKKRWSIRHKGRVIKNGWDYPRTIMLKDVSWVVQPAGRAKVLKEKRKNVHAFARGYLFHTHWLSAEPEDEFGDWHPVKYNPYKGDSFVRLVYDEESDSILEYPVKGSSKALLSQRQGRPAVWGLFEDN